MLCTTLTCLLLGLPGSLGDDPPLSAFGLTLERAERVLEAGQLEQARELIQSALERDRKAPSAWDLRARWAELAGDRDEETYSRHQEYRLSIVQGADRKHLRELRARLEGLDPLARDLYGIKDRFLKKLLPLALSYEKASRPHSAISVLKRILAIDPENLEAQAAIERIADSPDPSLAGDAKPKDLFANVTQEWVEEFDREHSTWEEAGEVERPNYITVTDAGYEVLIRTAEAMEQMNAFYREFFQYGTEEDGKSVPRIRVHVFKNRDEYLKLGIGPPVEWSGGHFTGSHVETYLSNGFESMTGTLFHEAAHQFVSLATRAVGWLNEGLASFFEGTRILNNGTVIMNMPANGRLYPLADRMAKGWMENAQDGYDPNDSDSTPEKAPTFRIVIENRYSWGPPWYAPTWGLVFFLYNYQDPVDGRYVYRAAFSEFINASGGKTGDTAVETFEEVVLANPKPAMSFVERPEDVPEVVLPQTVDEVDAVWKAWILALRDEQDGATLVPKPFATWGRYAIQNGDFLVAKEHFEKGLVAAPTDVDLLLEFADLLEEHFDNSDRASKLAFEALYHLEQEPERDEKRIRTVERLLSKLDSKYKSLARIQEELAASTRNIVERYAAAGLDLMVMDVAWRAGSELKLDDMLGYYEQAVRRSGRSLAIWELAYNEMNLDGWVSGVPSFRAESMTLAGDFGEYDPKAFDFQSLAMDRVTSGDFSLQADVQATRGEVNFCGFVFGQKSTGTFHGALLFPGKQVAEGGVQTGWLDLMSSYGGGLMKTWLHVPVQTEDPEDSEPGRTTSGRWHTLRIDVVARSVDLWFDGELVGTRDFPSRDVLRGSFGLLMGPGQARFKNIRYLARDPADPASFIERAITHEALAAADGNTGAIQGSYQNQQPPFPIVKRWAQGERSDWSEGRGGPQLLLLWSLAQNKLVRVDEWLSYLAEGFEDVGLEVVSIVSTHDDQELDAYLVDHPLPGAVGVDSLPEGDVGIGVSFEMFFVRRFNLPRLLLLDTDGTVIWEGDPGFEINEEPVEPFESFLDDPLEALVQGKKLRELAVWRTKWERYGQPALHSGDFEEALPMMQEAAEFDPITAPRAAQAHASLRAVQAAAEDLEGSADSLRQRGAESCMDVLVDWAGLLAGAEAELVEKDLRKKTAVRDVLRSKIHRDWAKVLKSCAQHAKGRGEPAAKAGALLGELLPREGTLVAILRTELEAAIAESDWAEVDRLAETASQRPMEFLAREYFGW